MKTILDQIIIGLIMKKNHHPKPNPTQWKPKDLLTNDRVAISVCWFRGRDGGLLGRDRIREAWGGSSVSAGRRSRQSPGRWGREDRGIMNSFW